MSFVPPIAIGEVITNKQLSIYFGVGNMGGMRRSRAMGTLILICDNTKGLYQDQWHDGRLLYTGMGKIGDQVLEGNQNKTLAESNRNGVIVYLFEVNVPGQYVFSGRVRLAAEPYQEIQPDENGKNRKVWIFPLEKVADENENHAAEFNDKVVEQASMQIREAACLSIDSRVKMDALNNLFTIMNQSYKLFWFRSILEGIRDGKSTQSFGTIINRMIADAWKLVAKYNLILGPADAVQRLVLALKEESGLSADADKNEVLSALVTSSSQEVSRLKIRLIQNVPYRLQSPFMQGEDWRFWDDYALTTAKINSIPETIYTIIPGKALAGTIQIRPVWMDYLTKNLDNVKQWTDEKLVHYLEKQNPTIGNIRGLLFPKEEAAGAQITAAVPDKKQEVEIKVAVQDLPEQNVEITVPVKGKKGRKPLTPRQKLWRRIKREFQKKKLIGDIAINDDEFALLVQELCNQHRRLLSQPERFEADEVFCVALVQFGIRYYDDGAYWPFIEQQVNPGYFKIQHRSSFGNAYLDFMKQNGKLLNEEKKAMSNILLHGFVSDHKSDELFDFLYAYYCIDLAKDIALLDRNAMNALIENIKVNNGRKRTYNLVEHTSDAVTLNEKGGKTRLRRYLNMIDQAFRYPDDFSIRSNNRLMKLFAQWWNDDEEKIKRERVSNKGYAAKHRSGGRPYLSYDFENDRFTLVLPQRVLNVDEEPVAYYVVKKDGQEHRIPVPTDPSVIGYISEEYELKLEKQEIFDYYEILFFCNGMQQIKWKIQMDSIRFFETNGDCVETRMLRPGDAVSFSVPGYVPASEALYDPEEWDGLLRCYYHFEEGDLIVFPDHKILNIGKKPAEGLLKRGLVSGAFGQEGDHIYPAYASAPSIFARILPRSMNGTQLRVNGKCYMLFEKGVPQPGVLVFDLQERAAEQGVHISLGQFGVYENGLYHIELDIPNDHANRDRDFLLINYLQYSFDEAPYVFVEKGVLCVPEETGLKAYDPVIKHICEDGQLQFAFSIPEEDECFRLSLDGLPVAFEIPKLSYRFLGEEAWRTKLQVSIWHTDLPDIIEIRYPADRISLLLDEEGNDDEDEEQHFSSYTKNQDKGMFVCDIHKFRSWFGKRVAVRRMYVKLPGLKKPVRFMNIYTRNSFVSAVLSADPHEKVIRGKFDIIGKAPCFVNIFYGEELLLEKEPIVDGKITIQSEYRSGIYRVDIYETDEDDDGFDDPECYLLASETKELINPYNLTGSHIEVKQLMSIGSDSYLRLKRSYTLYDLQPLENFGNGYYSGHLVVREREYGKFREDFPACVFIPDLDELSIGYLFQLDDYDDIEGFIYDNDRHYIRQKEDKNVKGIIRYIRFVYLSEDEYIYRIAFVEKPENMEEKLGIERAERALTLQGRARSEAQKVYQRKLDPFCRPINQIGLPISISNELMKAGIMYTTDLKNKTIRELSLLKSLDRSDIEKCIVQLRKIGYKISMF